MSQELLHAGILFCAVILQEKLQDLEKSKEKQLVAFGFY
jgi:hypothetical protein